MMKENKFHWYDGWFYDKILAPNQKKLFTEIIELIEPGKNIIDIGCGTGFFDFLVAEKCKTTLGIDISKRNIERANYNLGKSPNSKIKFQHTNFQGVKDISAHFFDYAVLTYVIHEINENERIPLICEIATKAEHIIIGDFLVSHPNFKDRLLTNSIEFIAGKDHYRNFRSYVAKGGIKYLAEKSGLKVIAEIKNKPTGTHIALLGKSTG